jgi:hypothetical protein
MAYKVEDTREFFEFEVGGKTYSVPKLADMPIAMFREIQSRIRGAKDGQREDEAVYALMDAFEKFAPGCTETLSITQASKLMQAYTLGGESLGESSASSN